MNIKIFCRCSSFPSWSGQGLTSTPVCSTVIANMFIIFEKKGFVFHRYTNVTAQASNTTASQHRQLLEPIEVFMRHKVHKQQRIKEQCNHTQIDRQRRTT
jgi:hypothetical protein